MINPLLQDFFHRFGSNLFIGLDLGLVLFLSFYLLAVRRKYGRAWREEPGVEGHIALTSYFVAFSVVRIWTAMLNVIFRHGVDATLIEYQFPLLLLGTGAAVVAMLCFIRVALPRTWGSLPWMATAVLAVSIAVLLEFA